MLVSGFFSNTHHVYTEMIRIYHLFGAIEAVSRRRTLVHLDELLNGDDLRIVMRTYTLGHSYPCKGKKILVISS